MESDNLRSYLASQTTAAPDSPESDASDPDALEATTGDETETPDAAPPSDEATEDEPAAADEPEDEPAPTTPDPSADTQAAIARAEAAEAQAAQDRQAVNAMWAHQAFRQMQDRWAGMDPEEAQADRARIVAEIAGRREQALQTENTQLRASIQQDWDLRENKPRAIAHITAKYTLTPDEVTLIADEADPLLMDRLGAKLQQRRQILANQARANARRQRIASGADRVGGQAGGARGAQPASTGNPLRDYLNQQTNATRR